MVEINGVQVDDDSSDSSSSDEEEILFGKDHKNKKNRKKKGGNENEKEKADDENENGDTVKDGYIFIEEKESAQNVDSSISNIPVMVNNNSSNTNSQRTSVDNDINLKNEEKEKDRINLGSTSNSTTDSNSNSSKKKKLKKKRKSTKNLEPPEEYISKIFPKGSNVFEPLPDEIMIRVYSHLDVPSIGRLSQVSKRFRDLSEDLPMWKELSTKRYYLTQSNTGIQPKDITKHYYIQKFKTFKRNQEEKENQEKMKVKEEKKKLAIKKMYHLHVGIRIWTTFRMDRYSTFNFGYYICCS